MPKAMRAVIDPTITPWTITPNGAGHSSCRTTSKTTTPATASPTRRTTPQSLVIRSSDVRVELLAPPPVLGDRLLRLRQHRPLPVHLVLPDRDVLAHARAERVGRQSLRLLARCAGCGEDPSDVEVLLVDGRRAREERAEALHPQHAKPESEAL